MTSAVVVLVLLGGLSAYRIRDGQDPVKRELAIGPSESEGVDPPVPPGAGDDVNVEGLVAGPFDTHVTASFDEQVERAGFSVDGPTVRGEPTSRLRFPTGLEVAEFSEHQDNDLVYEVRCADGTSTEFYAPQLEALRRALEEQAHKPVDLGGVGAPYVIDAAVRFFGGCLTDRVDLEDGHEDPYGDVFAMVSDDGVEVLCVRPQKRTRGGQLVPYQPCLVGGLITDYIGMWVDRIEPPVVTSAGLDDQGRSVATVATSVGPVEITEEPGVLIGRGQLNALLARE